ncbi:hypothetical protein HOB94_05540, partial [bacterium]|nr:hypothetical protein [bacterium]
ALNIKLYGVTLENIQVISLILLIFDCSKTTISVSTGNNAKYSFSNLSLLLLSVSLSCTDVRE